MFYDEWLYHWISDLLSQETIDNNTFKEWMWCPERYTDAELMFIERIYNGRRN